MKRELSWEKADLQVENMELVGQAKIVVVVEEKEIIITKGNQIISQENIGRQQ